MAMDDGRTNVAYWDDLADNYDDEVMDTAEADKGKIIHNCLRRCAVALRRGGRRVVAFDAGCGVGKWLPLLTAECDEVWAADVSARLVDVARRRHPDVSFRVADLAAGRADGIPRVDLAVVANVLISPDEATRNAILRNAVAAVRPGGTVVVLVPSSESARAVACVYRAAREPRRRRMDRWRDFNIDPIDAQAHVWQRWGVRTQCYTAATLMRFLAGAGKVEQLHRVEYGWDTELERSVRDAPGAIARPFDWLAVLRTTAPDAAAQNAPGGWLRVVAPRARQAAAEHAGHSV